MAREELGEGTRHALESLSNWLFVQGNEGAFAFGLFADQVTADSVFGSGSAGTSTPPAPSPPVSSWEGSTTEGNNLSFDLNLDSGEITLTWGLSGGGTSSFSSVVHLIASATSPGTQWFFHIPNPDHTSPFYALSLTQM
jgi:hypothetical protein